VHEIVILRQEHRSRQEFLTAIAKHEGFMYQRSERRLYAGGISKASKQRLSGQASRAAHEADPRPGDRRGRARLHPRLQVLPGRDHLPALPGAGPETVERAADGSLSCTGYDELSLASLSSATTRRFSRLIIELMEKYRDSRISVSLPSLRVGTAHTGDDQGHCRHAQDRIYARARGGHRAPEEGHQQARERY